MTIAKSREVSMRFERCKEIKLKLGIIWCFLLNDFYAIER
jgi:hypothetical protein